MPDWWEEKQKKDIMKYENRQIAKLSRTNILRFTKLAWLICVMDHDISLEQICYDAIDPI